MKGKCKHGNYHVSVLGSDFFELCKECSTIRDKVYEVISEIKYGYPGIPGLDEIYEWSIRLTENIDKIRENLICD
jgi:hypothetical protein